MRTDVKIPLVLMSVCLAAAGLFLFLGADADTTVYVTNSGTKYHRDGCSSLRRSKIAVTLADAIDSGYAPCGICRPPVSSGGTGGQSSAEPGVHQSAETESAVLYRVNVAGLENSAAADTGLMLRAEVVDHVDGDTVRVRIERPPPGLGVVETIRLLGVDTPETAHPRRPVERFGKAASDFTKARLLNKKVYLAFDWDLRDRYGRLLAYIYAADTDGTAPACFNAVLIREGYAHAYTRFAFQFAGEFRALEQEARRKKRGLWGE
jgi:micrococcal nuclease